MKTTKLDEAPKQDEQARQIPCAKCDHANPGRASVCAACGSQLFIRCHNCNVVSPRHKSRCESCGGNLRRGWWSRQWERWRGGPTERTSWVAVGLLVLAIAVAFWAILFVSNGMGGGEAAP